MNITTNFLTRIQDTFVKFELEDSFIVRVYMMVSNGMMELSDLTFFEYYDLKLVNNIKEINEIEFRDSNGDVYIINTKKINEIIKILNVSTHMKRVDKRTFLFFNGERIDYCIIYEKDDSKKPFLTILKKKDI